MIEIVFMRKIAYNLKKHGAVIRRRRASGIDCGDRLTTLAYMGGWYIHEIQDWELNGWSATTLRK